MSIYSTYRFIKQAQDDDMDDFEPTWSEFPFWDRKGDRNWLGWVFSFPKKNPANWKYLGVDLPNDAATRISTKPHSVIVNRTGKPVSRAQLQPYVDTRLEIEKFAPFATLGPMILKPSNKELWGLHTPYAWATDPWLHYIPNITRYYNVPDEKIKGVVSHEHNHGPTKFRTAKQDALYKSPLKHSPDAPTDVASVVMGVESPAVSSEASTHLLQTGTPFYTYRVFDNFPYWGHMPPGVSTFGLPKPLLKGVSNPAWYNKQFQSWTIPTTEQKNKWEAQQSALYKLYPNIKPMLGDVYYAARSDPSGYSRYRQFRDLVIDGIFNRVKQFEQDNDLTGTVYHKDPRYISFVKDMMHNGIPVEFDGKTQIYYPDPWHDRHALNLPVSSKVKTLFLGPLEYTVDLKDYYSPKEWALRQNKVFDNYNRFNVTVMDDASAWDLNPNTIKVLKDSPVWKPDSKFSISDIKTSVPENYNFEDVEDPLARGILQGKVDLDQASLIRRGMNYMVDPDNIGGPKVYVPYAPVIAQSEQEQMPRYYASMKQKLWSKLKDYETHPEYFNVMKRWRLTPYDHNIDNLEEDSLTLFQMNQIIKELDRATQLRRVEDNPQFQLPPNMQMA